MFYISRVEGVQAYIRGIDWRRLPAEEEEEEKEEEEGEEKKKSYQYRIQPSQKDIKIQSAIREALKMSKEKEVIILAAQVMSSPVETLSPDLTIAQACEELMKHSFRHIPVTSEEGKVIGILSDRDLLIHINDEKKTVQDIMVKDVLCSKSDTNILIVARTIIEERVGCLPVVDQQGRLLGIITRSDLLRTLFHLETHQKKLKQ